MVAKRQPRVLKKDTHLRRALCLSQDKPKAQLQVEMCTCLDRSAEGDSRENLDRPFVALLFDSA